MRGKKRVGLAGWMVRGEGRKEEEEEGGGYG